MAKPDSEMRLREALAELVEAEWHGARPSMAKICERAGVGRATAYRSEAFVEEYHLARSSALSKPKSKRREGKPSQQETISALRASINGFANLVQHLSLVNQQQRGEIERLLAAAPPTSQAGGTVLSLPRRAKARHESSDRP